MIPPRAFQSHSGSALISTMLVITVLTIIVVAFMQSMSVERQTAHSYLNRYRAELAAQAGANEAINLLLSSDSDCLVNAYAEDTVTYNGTLYTAPYLTTLKLDATATKVSETRYLCSSIDPTQSGGSFWRKPSTASSAAGGETTDINAQTSSSPEGLIGLGAADGSRRTIPVPWRALLADPIKAENEDRASANYNPIVGRYAYWIDDESAKVNVTTAGSVDTSNQHLHQAGRKLSEIAIHTILGSDAAEATTGTDTASFLAKRSGTEAIVSAAPAFPPSTYRNISTGLASDALWQTRRAFVTSWSQADERGPIGGVSGLAGIRKINLNDFVALAHDVTNSSGRAKIATDVVALGDYINAVLPRFGDRAANSGIDDADRRRYCVQIAANIQDFIDTDSQPTVVRQNLDSPQWEEAPDPNAVGDGAPTQPPAAFGKEAVPGVTEYVGYYYDDGGALRADHTFETLNIYTKDIAASTFGNLRIFLAQRDPITPGTNSNAPTPDMVDPLVFTVPADTVFPAGRYTLLTTLPTASQYRTQWVASGAAWTPLNWITLSRGEPTFAYGNNGLRMDGDQLATAADADTEIVLANDYGYLDINARVAQQGAIVLAAGSARVVASQPFGNAAASGTNASRAYPLDSGDPRSQTDVFPSYSESAGSTSMIAWRRNSANSQGATILGGDSNASTYGFMPDNSGTGADTATHVPEPLFGTNNIRATSVIRNGNMGSIGELGLIYDSALPDAAKTNGIWNRGGFRTLSIGTRYGDIASAVSGSAYASLPQATGTNNIQKRAYHLMDIFDTSNDINGRILLNSALRDPRNIPLRSVFFNQKTQSNAVTDSEFAGPADPNLTAKTAVNVDNVINALVTAAQTGATTGPFLSLGQIGDLDIFNTGTQLLSESLAPNAKNTAIYDRGREEVLRNSLQLLTLKGAVYTVYVVAEAGDSVNSKFVPRATTRLTRTVKLQRQYPAGPLGTITATDLQTNNTPLSGQTTVREITTEYY